MRYEFKCPECGGIDVVEAPMEEGPGVRWCLPCTLFAPVGTGFIWMKRVWHAAPAIFKGGGWASKS